MVWVSIAETASDLIAYGDKIRVGAGWNVDGEVLSISKRHNHILLELWLPHDPPNSFL